MGDYIEREDALHFMNAQREQIKKQMDETLVYEHFHTRSDLKCALLQLEGDIFLLESMSAADVAPVVRGRWINGHCNVCGNDIASKLDIYTNVMTFCFCPNCGADMREVDDG